MDFRCNDYLCSALPVRCAKTIIPAPPGTDEGTILVNKKIGSCFGAVFCLILAVPSEAALRYIIAVDIQREGTKVKTERLLEQVTMDGDQGRIDFLAPDGSKPGNSGYMLTLDGGKTFTWSDGGQAVCGNWSLEEFFGTVGALLEKGSHFINAKLPEARVEKTLEEPGPEMHGFPTTHLRLNTKYGAKGRVLIMKFEYSVEQTDDVWMTSVLELPAMERRWVETMGRTGFEYLDAMSATWDAEVTGVVLKHKNVVRLTNLQSSKVSVKTETMEVTAFERLDPSQIPEGTFAKPECRQVNQREMEEKATIFIRDSLK